MVGPLWIPRMRSRTGELFLPAYGFTSAPGDFYLYGHTVTLRDGFQDYVGFIFKVPDDFISFVSIKAVWFATPATGNMYWELRSDYGAAGESALTHTDYPGYGVTPTGGYEIWNVQEPENPLTLVNLARGDYVAVRLTRNATPLALEDTLGSEAYLAGLLFTYVAEG